jgi:aspartyl-tRNA(Asn)/glutamyl-tRNA(Gln) amidotransferase subunit C
MAFSHAVVGTRAHFARLKTFAGALDAHLHTMSLTITDVDTLVKLAQIKLDDAQKAKTLEQLNGIFALVEQMRAVDTTGVEPLNHPIDAYQHGVALRLRDDVVTEPNRRDDYQKVAPATQDGLYLVPQVIE